MKFIDWFAGIGGFRRGMEQAGHKCVGFCESDKYAVMSYTAMHLCTKEQLDYLATLPLRQRQKEILNNEYRNGEWYASDIREVRPEDIPKADCWCFGFPCQDISIARSDTKGLDGGRSGLFFRVIQLLGELKEEERPTYLFIENVKNLLSINNGWDFAKVLFSLDEVGYDAEWQVINSQDFVPQNRERVFIIGHLRGRCTSNVFPLEKADGETCVHVVKQVAMDGLSKRTNHNQWRVYDIDGISPTLNQMGGGGREPHVMIKITPDMIKEVLQ